MTTETGNLSINSENIFPIIKKWLYTDRDIFIRELIANGVDSITKMKRLVSMGEVQVDTSLKYAVNVYTQNGTSVKTLVSY